MRTESIIGKNDHTASLKASVVDLGYNSLKMVSYEVKSDGSFKAYDQRGELTRIGEGLDQTGFLGTDQIERTIAVLKLFNEVNKLGKVDRVLAIATSAVREAGNGPQFVREAEEQTGLRFRILTGEEEALFSYVGAAKATDLPSNLFFDLGGGSLELTYADGYRVKKLMSLPLGALRMTEIYGKGDGKFSKKEYNRMMRRVAQLLPTREELGIGEETVLTGVGGTLRALARYDQWLREYPLNKVHNYPLRRKSIMAIHKLLRRMNEDKISRIDAFGKDRAQSITAGSLIIGMMMNRLGFDDVVVSTHGLRDGVLSEHLRDPRSYSKEEFTMKRANASLAERRSESVRPRSNVVYPLAARGIIGVREEYILEEAIRSFMDLYLSTRPETLFYSIISQDSVLDHRDQLAAAIALVRAKAPKMAEWFYETYNPVLKGTERESIARMGAVIQLTEVLHLTGSSAKFKLDRDLLKIEIESAMGEDFPVMLLSQTAKDLEEATGLRVRTSVARSAGLRKAAAPQQERITR
jgi:exopolyphosphatase / guanosine-5'-triphosphate,3'-diphosphate pyrophosphatase